MTATLFTVLVLDREWRPLRIEPWRRTITDMFLGKVEVVEYSLDRSIRGVDREWPMPSVVRVLRAFKRERIRLKFSRLNIYARDRFTCQYCRSALPTEALTFDHVTPRSRGGRTCWENIVTCCVDCNVTKADRTPAEAGLRLAAAPRKPAYLPTISVGGMADAAIPKAWRPYWTGALD